MEFRLLGPVEVAANERLVPLGGQKPRRLFTALLVDHGRVVPVDRLVDAVWAVDAPERARAVLHTYVSTLRRSLALAGAHDAIVTQPPGYSLQLTSGVLDRDVFERLLREGRRACTTGRLRDAAELLRAAAAQWRGTALDGIVGELFSGEAARLNELRMAALEERIAADLALGRLDDIAAELFDLVGRHPFRERLRGQLMLALSGLGRRPDALAVYRQGRDALVEEMGIEPGPELRKVHQAVLRGAPLRAVSEADRRPADTPGPGRPHNAAGASGVGSVRRTGSARTVPAQLPAVPADFTGRRVATRQLAAALAEPGRADFVPVQFILGRDGIGKSTLAARVGHLVAGNYPDGQLHADLASCGGTCVQPYEVLGRFLAALGEPVSSLPGSLDERVGRFRTVIAGRRMLILLDDACCEQQVRTLLPGTSTSALIVTSRWRSLGVPGARVTELDMLTPGESMVLFERIVGVERVAVDEVAARQIVDYCDGLPLSLRSIGTWLASRRSWPLGLAADRLADDGWRLNVLSAGHHDVPAALAASYSALEPGARAVLTRLAVLDVGEFTPSEIAGAVGLSPAECERLVERLVDAFLADVARPDGTRQMRYRLPRLIRSYIRVQGAELQRSLKAS